MKQMIHIDKLVKNYAKTNGNETEDIKVIKGIDLDVNEGEYVGIMGKSGCGKTTLLKILGLIDRQTAGEMHFNGKDTKDLWQDELADIRRREIGFVFQDFYLMDSISVRENIMLPVILDKVDIETCKKNAEELAAQFEITHLLSKNPYELSGGEKQRVAICRALINDPSVIMADEPTGNLDSKSGKIVVDEFVKINEKLGKTIVMVTHDPKVASSCKKIVFLKDGNVLGMLEREGSEDEFYERIVKQMINL